MMENEGVNLEVKDEALKNITKLAKAINGSGGPTGGDIDLGGSEFKPCSNVLPEKPKFWTKLKNFLFYEIKVELSPYQQKMENEINDFLHQEVTMQSVKKVLFKEIKFR